MSRIEEGGLVSMCALRVDGQLFGIDADAVREVVQDLVSTPVPLAPPAIAGLAIYRGEVLAIVSLRCLLGLQRESAATSVLVMEDRSTEELFGLAVDAVEYVVMLPESSLEPNPSTLDARSSRFFAGTFSTQRGLMVQLDARTLTPGKVTEHCDEARRGHAC